MLYNKTVGVHARRRSLFVELKIDISRVSG